MTQASTHPTMAISAGPEKNANGGTALVEVRLEDIPITCPARTFGDRYVRLLQACGALELPKFSDLLEGLDGDLINFCLILIPVRGDRTGNFQVLHRGRKIPGSNLSSFKFGEKYTDYILPQYANERLMELTTSIARGERRFSHALSARRSALHIEIFRAVLPVWLDEHLPRAVVLVSAPPKSGS